MDSKMKVLKTALRPAKIIHEGLMSYDDLRDICPPSSVSKSYDIQRAMEELISAAKRSGVVVFVVKNGDRTSCIPELAYLAKTSEPAYYTVTLEYAPGLEDVLAKTLNKIWRINVSADVIRVQLGLMMPPVEAERGANGVEVGARQIDRASDVAEEAGALKGAPQPTALEAQITPSPPKIESKRAEEEEEEGRTAEERGEQMWTPGVARQGDAAVKKGLEDALNMLLNSYSSRELADLAYILVESPWIVKYLVEMEPDALKALFNFYEQLRKAELDHVLPFLTTDEDAIIAVVEQFHPELYNKLRRCLRGW